MKINLWKLSTLGLAGALAFVLAGSHVRDAAADPSPSQPHMQSALQLLQASDAHLDAATADKGGHRVKAREYTKKAIEEVKKGIAFDATHDGGVNENKKSTAN